MGEPPKTQTSELRRNRVTGSTLSATRPIPRGVPDSDEPHFSERFILAPYAKGGLVLDLKSGDYHRLNGAAQEICEALGRGLSCRAVAERLSQKYGRELQEVAKDVDSVWQGLFGQTHRARPAPPNPISFRAESSGFTLYWYRKAVLGLDEEVSTIRLCRPPGGGALTTSALQQWLLWAAPHILVFHGQPVIHASTVRFRNTCRAFLGQSGSGKSTTARTLEEQGATAVSDDLLLLRFRDRQVWVAGEAESLVRQWAARAAKQLAGGGPVVRTAPLLECVRGPFLEPLSDIWIFDSPDSRSDRLTERPLTGPDAWTHLLNNAFAEMASRKVWSETLEVACALETSVPIRLVSMPNGLERLQKVLPSYF